jgi:hypothetical protein
MPEENTTPDESVIAPKNVTARSEATRQSVQAEQETPPLPPPAPAINSEAALNERITALVAENAAAVEILSQRHADLIALQGSHDSAVTAYRNLLISTNPAVFSEDCLPGVTIQEIEASAKKVNDIAAKIRAQLQADIKAVIVPAGAPERSGPDTSAMSPHDKIKYAIETANMAK